MPAVHIQTLKAAVASLTKEFTRQKRGQPIERNETVIDEICASLECGEVLTMICTDPAMPGYRMVTPRIFRK
ncbi:hypothetical protein [Sphingomonas sp. 10B4]|uniref:terminase small subunit-like protein n=1 Tax=Sphingomonas sp. 10B4 TaxID=3048575 RepID=UPI003A0FF617